MLYGVIIPVVFYEKYNVEFSVFIVALDAFASRTKPAVEQLVFIVISSEQLSNYIEDWFRNMNGAAALPWAIFPTTDTFTK